MIRYLRTNPVCVEKKVLAANSLSALPFDNIERKCDMHENSGTTVSIYCVNTNSPSGVEALDFNNTERKYDTHQNSGTTIRI